MPKPTLVYDLGALVSDDLTPMTEQLAADLGRGEHEVENAIAASLPRYAAGEISQGTHWDMIAGHLGLEESDTIAAYAELAATVDPTLLGRVRVQSPQMTLGLLSDATPDWVGHFRRTHKLDRLFASHIIDSELAGSHTYRQLLELAAERLQTEPSQITFVDTKPKHLETARELGMRVIDVSKPDYAEAFKNL